jgi:transposase InsO family protein
MVDTLGMPWMTKDTMSLRMEFVTLAREPDGNIAQLCRRYAISRQTGYKWMKRYGQSGRSGLEDRSRRPHRICGATDAAVEQRLVALRKEHPAWGPRKLRRRLEVLGQSDLPAPSTIAAILRRNGLVGSEESARHTAFVRFERSEPNELWQMDFKGYFAMGRGGNCHPLTVLDDCARFLLGLRACANEQGATVHGHLRELFRLYGLPLELLCDNGAPWGGRQETDRWSSLSVWLLRLGIRVCHGRPYHPQTQGKDERLHRTLKAEVLCRHDLRDLAHAQQVFGQWRSVYNHERPHQALDMDVPASRYRPSLRSFPETLPPIEYDGQDIVKTVKQKGEITWRNRTYYIGQAFAGLPIALRPGTRDGLFEVFFCHQSLGWINLLIPSQKPKHHYLQILKTP